jgi:hypothetical protein
MLPENWRKITFYFEFTVHFYSLLLHSLYLFILSFFDCRPIALSSHTGQLAIAIIVGGFFLRLFSTATQIYLKTIKLTGPYSLCRHPLTLSLIIIAFGINIIASDIRFSAISIVTILFVNIFNAVRYDRILNKRFDSIWVIYKKNTNFLIPIPYRFKDFMNFRINNREYAKSLNWPIFLAIYTFLILSSIIVYIHLMYPI